MPAACQQTLNGIYQAIKAKVNHWSARGLSFLGRVHVAKQVLAASLWYHATFQRPSDQLLKQISRQLRSYVASAQQHNHSDAAVALAQGNSQSPAHLPSQAPSGALFPGVLTSSLPPAQGGVGLVEVPTQIQALQAKVVSRLLEPERLAWKVFQVHQLAKAPQLGYGAGILFSTLPTSSLHLPPRLLGYVTAFRALQPHRLLPIDAMPTVDVLTEPLFLNRQIVVPVPSPVVNGVSVRQRPLTPQHQPLLLAAGITKVAHLQTALQLQHPQPLSASLHSVLQALPPAWQAIAMSAPSAPTWLQGLIASGSQHILHAHTGQRHTVSPHQHQLLPAQPQAVTNVCPGV